MSVPRRRKISVFKGRQMKYSDITKEWFNIIPKTINSNGCWIPDKIPGQNGYIYKMIDRVTYILHRLVVAIYYSLDYHDQSWDARHGKGCDRACFFIGHLQPGSQSDNVKDQVRDGVHNNASKIRCPKCGNEFDTQITKSGPHKGKIQRYCRDCRYGRSRNKNK